MALREVANTFTKHETTAAGGNEHVGNSILLRIIISNPSQPSTAALIRGLLIDSCQILYTL